MNGFETYDFVFILFGLMFVGLWCFMAWLAGLLGGWWELAERFACRERFRGKRYRFRSGAVGGMGYNHCLTIGIDETDLYLAPTPPFGLFHKPLLIPWQEIRARLWDRSWSKTYELSFRSLPRVTVLIHGPIFEKMAAYVELDTGEEGG